MKLIGLLAGAGLLAAAAAGPAVADTWSGAFGNTIVATYADGRVVKVYVEPDHSYSIATADGQTIEGTWADAAGQSCFTITAPAAYVGSAPTCFPAKDYKVGEGFDGQDSSGAFHGLVTAGR